MDVVAAVGAVLALVAATTVLGLVWRARTGRVRAARADSFAELVGSHGALGSHATLLQFSTEFCAPCRATARLLGELVTRRDGTAHVEVDLTARPELAQRLGILQTPTVFVLDASGESRARIGGAPRLPELLAVLDGLGAPARPIANGDDRVRSA